MSYGVGRAVRILTGTHVDLACLTQSYRLSFPVSVSEIILSGNISAVRLLD